MKDRYIITFRLIKKNCGWMNAWKSCHYCEHSMYGCRIRAVRCSEKNCPIVKYLKKVKQ
jgi:hypothetical protein